MKKSEILFPFEAAFFIASGSLFILKSYIFSGIFLIAGISLATFIGKLIIKETKEGLWK
ncbi:MAG: hypothetical protein WC679_12450 [Bacteroidales bacterium]|jgi:hypothetical protein